MATLEQKLVETIAAFESLTNVGPGMTDNVQHIIESLRKELLALREADHLCYQHNNNNNNNAEKRANRERLFGSVSREVTNAEHVGLQPHRSVLDHAHFDPADKQIHEDVIRIVIQFLQDEGYHAASMTLQDEANVKMTEQLGRRAQYKRVKKAILEGDWPEVEKMCQKHNSKNYRSLLFAISKQQYLELIDRQEYQKAFSFLSRRLKPLETLLSKDEFKDLCYLLTCKSVQDVPTFKEWEGIQPARERLVEQFQAVFEFDSTDNPSPSRLPNHRLLHLLQQAVAYQIEQGRYHPRVPPKVTTLLEDYRCFVLPNAQKAVLAGHKGNVKCVEFIGEEGKCIASGSSDNTIRIWNTESGSCVRVLEGHTSRIWDITSSRSGDCIASASGDSTVKVWGHGLNKPSATCQLSIGGHEGDVYSVRFHPGGNHLVTGGYDKTVRLFDVRTGALVRTFAGHTSSVSRALFNPHGNLIISGSKDSTIKFWDIVSGVCIKTFSSYLGEVTSLDLSANGALLLSCSKDNSNRLWDLRMGRPVQRFKGHQNTSKNFVRVRFGPNEKVVVGGSEDGMIYLWDLQSGSILQRLRGHSAVVYDAAWSSNQSLLASCSNDSTVRMWWYDAEKALFTEDTLEGS
eukprot:GILJ01005791.1.p1 GENE.GILJ01005791.1~~GILJ01005791.1.p1  ORF type:complete len:646 (-),score=96.73 GILJ01005791.1:200-2086(-)